MCRLHPIVPFICALLISIPSFAQLPDGTEAPDWTATDINGIEHNLYSYIDSGYAVILDFSATWCPPCWTYHNSGVLEELYESHGPDGTNKVRIFFIEADDNTTDADLIGTGTNTLGDWTVGVNYPIIDNGGDIFSSYENTYYPTLYTVCPSGLLNQIGQASYDAHVNYVESLDCAIASLPSDPSILSYTGPVRSCPGEDVPLSVRVMNNGIDPLTSCTFEATTLFGTELLTYEWSGNLDTYEIEDIQLGNAPFLTTSIFFIDIVSEDDNAANNSVSSTMNLSSQTATSLIRVRVTTDDNPADNRWSITDLTGAEVAGISFGDLVEPNTEYIWWESMPSEGCYTFDIFDFSGNGGNINCDLSTFNDDLQNINTIFTASNNGAWTNLNKGFLVNAINTGLTEFNGTASPILLHPNPANTQIVLNAIDPFSQGIRVHHTSGALAKEWPNPTVSSSGSITLDISDLASGVYVLSSYSFANKQTAKLIIR